MSKRIWLGENKIRDRSIAPQMDIGATDSCATYSRWIQGLGEDFTNITSLTYAIEADILESRIKILVKEVTQSRLFYHLVQEFPEVDTVPDECHPCRVVQRPSFLLVKVLSESVWPLLAGFLTSVDVWLYFCRRLKMTTIFDK